MGMALMCSSPFPSSLGAAALALGFILFLSMSTVTSSHRHHHHPWESFRNLTGCRQGDHRPGLAQLKQYFHRFGYLPGSPSNFSDYFGHDLELALAAYQRNFLLNATGTVDSSTLSHIMEPRCGVADFGVKVTTPQPARGRHLYSTFPGRPVWPTDKRQLTYAYRGSGVSNTLLALASRAFNRWSDYTVFSFSETDEASADIHISFFRGDHGDRRPFDGSGGVLAHAFAPTSGELHVDADEVWVVAGDVTQVSYPYAMDLESVLVHEIGHILGLGHSNIRSAIMYPSIAPRTRKVLLTSDDVSGIQDLYGNK